MCFTHDENTIKWLDVDLAVAPIVETVVTAPVEVVDRIDRHASIEGQTHRADGRSKYMRTHIWT